MLSNRRVFVPIIHTKAAQLSFSRRALLPALVHSWLSSHILRPDSSLVVFGRVLDGALERSNCDSLIGSAETFLWRKTIWITCKDGLERLISFCCAPLYRLGYTIRLAGTREPKGFQTRS